MEWDELEPSSIHLSRLRLRAFMKKLLTVVSSSPSCCEMVICNSLEGRLFSLNIACKVRRWTSVKTSRGFLDTLPRSPFPCSCSFLLHAERGHTQRYYTSPIKTTIKLFTLCTTFHFHWWIMELKSYVKLFLFVWPCQLNDSSVTLISQLRLSHESTLRPT